MTEETNGRTDVEKLKNDLKELIDQRIEYNNGFANLLRGDYSLILSLIALIISAYSAQKLGFLAQQYVLSVYLMFGIWLLYSIIDGVIRAPKRAPDESELEVLNKLLGIKTHLKDMNFEKLLGNLDPDKVKILIIFGFKWIKPFFYSLGTLFLLSIPMLLFIGEKRPWLWMPAILFTIILPLIAKKGPNFFVASIGEIGEFMSGEEMHKIESIKVWKWMIALMMVIVSLVLAIAGIYLYYVISELFFIIIENLSALFEVILTIVLILISLAFLSEYLSMKFMITEVSEQNYNLSVLSMKINQIEDVKELIKHKKELRKLFLPKADSFLVFFNYYYLMLTPYTFEIGQEKDEGQQD